MSGEASTASGAAKTLESRTGIKVSEWTARRALRDVGYKAIEKKKKPALLKKNIKARIEFAKRYKNFAVDDWKRVIWSDEVKINRCGSDGSETGKNLNQNM